MAEFRKCFHAIDVHDTGQITLKDLENYMKKMNYKEEFLTKWINLFHVDADGVITYEHFCKTLGVLPRKHAAEEMEVLPERTAEQNSAPESDSAKNPKEYRSENIETRHGLSSNAEDDIPSSSTRKKHQKKRKKKTKSEHVPEDSEGTTDAKLDVMHPEESTISTAPTTDAAVSKVQTKRGIHTPIAPHTPSPTRFDLSPTSLSQTKLGSFEHSDQDPFLVETIQTSEPLGSFIALTEHESPAPFGSKESPIEIHYQHTKGPNNRDNDKIVIDSDRQHSNSSIGAFMEPALTSHHAAKISPDISEHEPIPTKSTKRKKRKKTLSNSKDSHESQTNENVVSQSIEQIDEEHNNFPQEPELPKDGDQISSQSKKHILNEDDVKTFDKEQENIVDDTYTQPETTFSETYEDFEVPDLMSSHSETDMIRIEDPQVRELNDSMQYAVPPQIEKFEVDQCKNGKRKNDQNKSGVTLHVSSKQPVPETSNRKRQHKSEKSKLKQLDFEKKDQTHVGEIKSVRDKMSNEKKRKESEPNSMERRKTKRRKKEGKCDAVKKQGRFPRSFDVQPDPHRAERARILRERRALRAVERRIPDESKHATKQHKRPTTPLDRWKVRPSLRTRGSIVILLAGTHRGKRVVYLGRHRTTGLLLVTGPFKYNGCPLRRVHPDMVIVTKTRINLKEFKLPSHVHRKDYFARSAKPKRKPDAASMLDEAADSDRNSFSYTPSEQRKQDQSTIDRAICDRIKAHPESRLLIKYLKSLFSLGKRDRPHRMIF